MTNNRRKLENLLRPRLLDEVIRTVKRWLRPLSTRRLLRGIDVDRFAYLQRRHCDLERLRRPQGYLDARKYLDLRRFLEISKRDAQELGLTSYDAGRPLRILDLGSGPGYFGYVCGQLGHHCVNLDTDEEALFTQIHEILGLDRVVHRIEPGEVLPEFAERFDLITAHSVRFHCRDEEGVWGADEWDVFLRGAKRLLNPGGRLCLRLNLDHQRTYFDADVMACFLAHGFKIRGSRASLRMPRRSRHTAAVGMEAMDGTGLAAPRAGV